MEINKEFVNKCNLCGSRESIPLYNWGATNSPKRMEPLNNVICKYCGLVYLGRRMNDKTTSEYYAKYKDITIKMPEPTPEFVEISFQGSKVFLKLIEKYLAKGKRLLDVGCGFGSFLFLVAQKGCIGVGVNPEEGFSKFGREKYGLNILTCLFEETNFNDKSFDIIVFIHVFEHFRDPTKVLLETRRILKNDGIVFISTPNVLTPHGFLWENFLLEHTFTFSPRTLDLIFKKTGFKIKEWNKDGHVTPEGYHHPYMNVVAKKAEFIEDINFSEEGDAYQEVIRKLKRYQRNYVFFKGGYKFYIERLLENFYIKYVKEEKFPQLIKKIIKFSIDRSTKLYFKPVAINYSVPSSKSSTKMYKYEEEGID